MRTTLTVLFFSLMVIRCYTVAEREPVCAKTAPTPDTIGYRAFPNGLIRPNGDTLWNRKYKRILKDY